MSDEENTQAIIPLGPHRSVERFQVNLHQIAQQKNVPTPLCEYASEERKDQLVYRCGKEVSEGFQWNFYSERPLLKKAGLLSEQEYQGIVDTEMSLVHIIGLSSDANCFIAYAQDHSEIPRETRRRMGVNPYTEKNEASLRRCGIVLNSSLISLCSAFGIALFSPETAIGAGVLGILGLGGGVLRARKVHKVADRRRDEETKALFPAYREKVHQLMYDVPQYLQEVEETTTTLIERGSYHVDVEHLTPLEVKKLSQYVVEDAPRHISQVRQVQENIEALLLEGEDE